ncbi:MAG: tRNA (adenosine(37)-N6)-threonylcarbamoyltransferase complex ATPase subunit type 1 TsaE [Verrucomicrobiales bacterium]|nr:tRNA (adenosine(37)-N6)-threonylcarbamoyltransferase complex ATPase subunit type 1 TsaE [Verrucomicrobiales bacterium]|tara:strand:+ start:24715 stop:25200 length:486 start_codon:yes stop_codon:yes gene_type:complete
MNWQASPFLFDRSTHSPEETQRLGGSLAAILQPGDCVCLTGTLGAGKTTFVRGLIQGILGPETTVNSPTFNIVSLYDQGPFPIWHIDLYRFENDDEWIELGLNETQEGLLIIEWPEKAEKFIRQSALVLNFDISQNNLKIIFTGTKNWSERLKPLQTSFEK